MHRYEEYVSMSFGCEPLYSHSSIRFLVKEKIKLEGYKVERGVRL